MQITIDESANRLYLALLDQGRIDPSIAENIKEVTCLMLFDAQGDWSGLRLLPQTIEGLPLLLPSALSCDFPLKDAYLRQTPDFVEINFAKGIKPSSFLELACSLDVFNGELLGLELITAKVLKGRGFVEPFIRQACSE